MKFTLEIDLDQIPEEKTQHELAHILRHWAGTLREHDLAAGEEEPVFDSGYTRVGKWTVADDGHEGAGESAGAD